ncbi:PREDICTED: tripartite motif-containing protein 3-like [Branchiostoma belcheri]|uniref:RING-type E3 ubiquitin transferase n=1 Tax=Branchiostoma belcheri TaxID=7741 RepID=A0A6P4YH75_BRABE|nr:PREDICTED: tripartite motif-containing protein 3-like [Branchiostoma belcheri]
MGSAPSSLKIEIHEELSCSICLELFTRPKVLPCQHTFCQDCLRDHAEVRTPFECPNCRRQIRLPRQGVAGLPDNLITASMCEKLQKQEALLEETVKQPQSGNRCSFHPSEEVKLYCKQCNSPVCTECYDDNHDGHPTTGLKKVQERRSTVQDLINEGRNILESYCSFIKCLGEREKKMDEQKQQRENGIIQAYNRMVQKLTERKDFLLSESEQNHSENLEKIQTERDPVLADINELSAACDRAEQELQQGWVEFLSQQTALTEVVGKYRGKAAPTPPVQTQPAVFQPTDTPVPVLGHVTVQSLPSASIPEAPAARGTGHHHGNQRQSVKSLPSAPIPAVPTSTCSNDAARGTGHHHGNQRQGNHQPQKVIFGGPGSGTGQFWGPCGVTVSDEGEIFVADCGLRDNQRIQVFTLHGTFVRQFPTVVSGELKIRPDDVAMDEEGNLWVVGKSIGTFSANYAVQYNKQGRVLRKFGLQKSRMYRGVAVDTRRNHILITQTTMDRDSGHDEVQVFRPDGTLVRTVGRASKNISQWGHQEMSFRYQQYIAVNGEENILLTDPTNHFVYVYKEDGQFLFQFGGEGSGEGQLKHPRGICTDRAGNIIVADQGNKRVEMFDKAGRFLKHITTDMEGPQAVAMATQEQLVVTDHGNQTVSVLHNY